jgi:hypothetical protein
MKSDVSLTEAEMAELIPTGAPGTAESEDKQSKSHADRLVGLVHAQGIELFRDQYGEAYARINCGGHNEILRCQGKEFCRWMVGLYWKQEQKAINSEAIRAATNVLSAQARFDGQEHHLHNRTATSNGAIWYDLSDDLWRAVCVTPQGWQIVNAPPVLFRRYKHQCAQLDPVAGGSLNDLIRFTNLANDGQALLLRVVLLSFLVPDIPHPVLVIHGPQGSTKTTHLRILRRLIDPSKTETLSLPHDRSELVQQLSHHYAPTYDNVSHMPEWISDSLCRAVTGEGHSKRELYTDDDDVIYQFRRCISINGINVAAQRPDLLSRSILIGLQSIPDERRCTEEAYYREFEAARPKLFGAMLDILTRAMALVNSIRLPRLPRLADFCRWGCAISEVMGFDQRVFLDAFYENVGLGHEEVIGGSQVAHAIQCLMRSRELWDGTPQELYRDLNAIAERENLNTHSREWPRAANALTRRLNEITADLLAFGIHVETGERTGKNRKVAVRNVTENIVTAVTPSPSCVIPLKDEHLQRCDDSDDIFRNTAKVDKANLPKSPDCTGGSGVSMGKALGSSDDDDPVWLKEIRNRLTEIKRKHKAG